MNDPKNITIKVTNQDRDSLMLTLSPDTEISGFVDAFRSIAFWLTFHAGAIDENIPDGFRGWSYDDEREPDEHGPGGNEE
jgi:hypothetical protein